MENITNKHAFLIMAYDDFDFLKELMMAIDDERNDIYLHIDRRAKVCKKDIEKITNKARVFFVDGIKVTWGSENQIEAELRLLKASLNENEYKYYHLLSGHDFPLVSQNEFHEFFDEKYGFQFIDCRFENIEPMLFRVKYYFPFQTLSSGKNIFNRFTNKVGTFIQRLFGINRTIDSIIYGYGGNWFSITDDFARYVVSMEEFIKKNFYQGLCSDEMFIQTLWLNSPMFDINKLYENIPDNSKLEQHYRNALRAVDFLSGTGISPCTFNENDYEMLKKSSCIFARKLDSNKSMLLVKRIKDDWR